MNELLVQVQDVGKSFRLVQAVDGVSFEVRSGEIFALLGPNGAGKSTLVRMMIGMMRPDHGAIRWHHPGATVNGPDPRYVGYLPEDRGLYRDQKVAHILEYFGRLRGLSGKESRAAAEEWAARLEVSQHLNSKLETLSKGNQQKVQVAAAVLHRPGIAILDEPFSGLDPLNQEMMLNVIRFLRDEGTTVLLSAHQLELVERLADRVFLLANGRRVLEGTVADVKCGVHSGYSLRMTFSKSVPEELLHAWSDDDRLFDVDRISDFSISLTLNESSIVPELLQRARSAGELTEFRGGSLSLHEIYLRALNPNVKTPDTMNKSLVRTAT
ncbi:MAG: ATP-binding cassette domain-containing protein [Planctomyces sp.]|nr:ATP-binding cassette domain-containing protein [Planctomyces sp.]